jgi:hypothetical protein
MWTPTIRRQREQVRVGGDVANTEDEHRLVETTGRFLAELSKCQETAGIRF